METIFHIRGIQPRGEIILHCADYFLDLWENFGEARNYNYSQFKR